MAALYIDARPFQAHDIRLPQSNAGRRRAALTYALLVIAHENTYTARAQEVPQLAGAEVV